MDVKLHPSFANNSSAREAATAIEACVHCGFCLATCPTYLDTHDERDSPRGRIYLVRELLEQGQSDQRAQHHLDRCLSCQACESTCPSGVRYGAIADNGRALLEDELPRPIIQRALRELIRKIVPYSRRFAPLLRCGQILRPALPAVIRKHIPRRQAKLAPARPALKRHTRQVILLDGCVQSAATPRTNQAATRILDRIGVSVHPTPAQGCCGALDTHIGYPQAGLNAMRRNIDAWWPAVEAGAEAVLSTATGCGALLQDYAAALRSDPIYAAKAERISQLAQDFGTYLLAQPRTDQRFNVISRRVAVHIPCSQTHALQTPHTVKQLLDSCGYTVVATRDDHLCCGSAGTYSLLQSAMSERLRSKKLQALTGEQPDIIASANVGCQLHLGATSDTPVVHWTELYLNALPPA